MKKFLLSVLLMAAATASAATIYQDRFVTGGAPCMIEFAGAAINATMVKDVQIGNYSEYVAFHLFSGNEYRKYSAVRMTLINNSYYQVTEGNLEYVKAGLMAQIAECGKRK